MTMPKGWDNSNNNANTNNNNNNNNNNLPLSRKQKKLLDQKANLEASLNDVRMKIQKEEERDKGPRRRKQNKLYHHKTNLELSLQDVWRQIQKEEQKQQDKYLKKHNPPSSPTTTIEPQLVSGEQILWQRNITKGFWKKKIVEYQLITNMAVRINRGALDLQQVDRIEVTNRHSRGRGKGTTYSVGGRGGPRVHFSEGESRSRHFGDLVFLSQGQVLFTIPEVEDAAGVKRLVKAANPHIK
jgi:hypothetical protein